MMRQLLLNLDTQPSQTFDTFVVGKNRELIQLLSQLINPSIPRITHSDRFIYLWGESGVGKTHLLRALATYPATRYLNAQSEESEFIPLSDTTLYLLDDCDRLSDAAQIYAFNLFNELRAHDGILITTGSVAPAILPVREDLRTRMAWSLIYQVHGLSDEEKIKGLAYAAHARGITLSSGVLPYLITHFKRDMRSLSNVLDALDHYSMETQRPITLPMLKDFLKSEQEEITHE